jgi:orotidine-5'-phosphate decarboxylase
MTTDQLFKQIKQKQSFLCVGLDTDFNILPRVLMQHEYPVFEFNRQIIDATAEYAIAYKLNLAFYEVLGTVGWVSLEMTVNYIRKRFPDIFIIADAKRGDIGNTSKMYAKAFFERIDFDAITLSPYMGADSITPFLEYQNKWVILLALTSNPGADDFQQLVDKEKNIPLYEHVIQTSEKWGSKNNLMYVVGATRAELLLKIRKIIPDHFLLIPGVGAQGGSLSDVAQFGFNSQCGLIVNSSRAIIYADCTNDFAKVARSKAREVQEDMCKLLIRYQLL